MSPKVAKESKASKAEKPAKAGKEAKAAGASPKKGAKASAKDEIEEVVAAPAEGEPQVDLEELEEQEAERAANSGGGNAAALAAASSTTEMSASFKNFRHHPDMENFYRFIYENDLRHEALAIIDTIQTEKQARRAMKTAKTNAH
ncbi:MAG: hypothetical protein ACJ763_04745 [Bdellovibrionia bacterium]